MTVMESLAPQMLSYSKQFHTDGDVEWTPYLMFFHPKNYASDVVNTDSHGFRFSESGEERYSVATSSGLKSANLIAGNSVVFGIGASSDRNTIASRMMRHDPDQGPWLNFGGRAFNSSQELILLTLYRHMLPKIDEIILFSGFNNLCLARLPEDQIQEHGAFYNCGRFYDVIQESSTASSNNKLPFYKMFGRTKKIVRPENSRSLDERIKFAADLTLRHLDGWNAVAKDMGAKLTFILQPTSGWVREKGCKEEEALFAEIENLPRYTTVQRDVLQKSVCQKYATMLETGTMKRGISFLNISPALSAVATDEKWLFIDQAHLTDDGYDLVANQIIASTNLKI